MAKRVLPSSAFALPGLSKPDSKKPYSLSSSRGDYFSSSSRNLPLKNAKASTVENLNVSSNASLTDGKGSLLPPQTKHTLDNKLTKTRPRNPGRRTPSPLARRKFELDYTAVDPANVYRSSSEVENVEKTKKDLAARIKERTTFSPPLILSNDVGLSISSNEFSVSRTSPKLGIKNRVNPPEVPPKPDRNRSHVNVQDVEEKSDQASGMTSDKIVDKETDHEDHDPQTMEPPPLPTSPPPLEDDVSPTLDGDTLNKEEKPLLQGAMFGKATKTANESNFDYDLSTKFGKFTEHQNEVNGLNRTKQSNNRAPSNDSPPSRIAKWQGYGQTWSDSNQAHGMLKVGAGNPDRQTSFDSAILSRLSKYETPYSSRQRKPVDKNPSSRRRRFKPVTLGDDSEKTNPETAVEIHDYDSPADLVTGNSNPRDTSYERLPGMQVEKSFVASLPQDHDKGINMKTWAFGPKDRTMDSSFQRSNNVQDARVKPNFASGSGNNTTEKSRQHSYSPDKFGMSRTTSSEPTVMLEYDVSNSAEKAIEIETNETVPFVSDTRTSNRSESMVKNEISDNYKNDDRGDENDSMEKQQGSSGQTLPKVVIQYDGEVFSDPMIHGYDTETSDEGKKIASSFGRVQNQSMTHENNSESDSSLHAEDNNVEAYGEYSDEEEDLDLGLDDASLEDEDITFEDLESAREEMERVKGWFTVKIISIFHLQFGNNFHQTWSVLIILTARNRYLKLTKLVWSRYTLCLKYL